MGVQVPCGVHPEVPQKSIYGQLRKHFGELFGQFAKERECEIVEGQVMPDHVHMLISIPPRHAVWTTVGYIKGKSAIHIASAYLGGRRPFRGYNFWARGYFVSTVGRDETTLRVYIRNQENEDRKLDPLSFT